MLFYLRERDLTSTELMDDPDCDKELLFNTYKQFVPINKLVSSWHRIYKKLMLPHMKKNPDRCYTVLDVGCGGGDILSQLASFAKKDGLKLELHGIDPDINAEMFRKTQNFAENIRFSTCYLIDLLVSHDKYDFVINNNVLHHLTSEQMQGMISEAKEVCTIKVIFNDIERNDLTYLLFCMFILPFRNSFARNDGALSIKRSYTRSEIAALLPKDWKVQCVIPSRLLIVYEKE